MFVRTGTEGLCYDTSEPVSSPILIYTRITKIFSSFFYRSHDPATTTVEHTVPPHASVTCFAYCCICGPCYSISVTL